MSLVGYKQMFQLKAIPNLLTVLRILLIPLFVVTMADPSLTMRYVAVSLFVVAALTDLADGIIARRFSAVSDLGKLLDPLADKILVMAALVTLCSQRTEITGDSIVPGWLVVLILGREIWITGLRSVAASQGIIVAASEYGKLKTAFQIIAIGFLILGHLEFSLWGVIVTARTVGLNLLFVSLFFSYSSGVEYTFQVFSLVTKQAAGTVSQQPVEVDQKDLDNHTSAS
jgi:CDP-diacylglycerol---glycerol-3-phosphate 3-phosphatidyltransferase